LEKLSFKEGRGVKMFKNWEDLNFDERAEILKAFQNTEDRNESDKDNPREEDVKDYYEDNTEKFGFGREKKFFGTWREGIKILAPDSATLIMRGKLKLKTRPTDLEAMELIERYKDKTFDEVEKILDDAKFWLNMIRILSFENEAEKKGRSK